MKKRWLVAIRVMEARPRKVTEATPSAHQAAARKNYFFFKERITFLNDKLATKKKIFAHQISQKKLHRPICKSDSKKKLPVS